MSIADVALAIARLGIDAAEGKIDSAGDVARSLVGLGLDLVPHDELQRYLTEAGVARAESVADLAESVKFKGST
jgi:hypothetical protein